MSKETRRLTNDLIDISKLVIIAIILIFVIFSIIKELAGQLPAYLITIIAGLGGVFVYATNKKVREHISDWLKGENKWYD